MTAAVSSLGVRAPRCGLERRGQSASMPARASLTNTWIWTDRSTSAVITGTASVVRRSRIYLPLHGCHLPRGVCPVLAGVTYTASR